MPLLPPPPKNSGPRIINLAVCAILVGALSFAFSFEGCVSSGIRPDALHYQNPYVVKMTVTGYCNCGKCCGWRYNWYGKPVTSTGGKTKKIGLTASGVRARPGTVAVDTSKYPFGTIFEIPGYGYARAEDIGGAIKGEHLDAWFPSHEKARKWGKKTLEVKVWLPK